MRLGTNDDAVIQQCLSTLRGIRGINKDIRLDLSLSDPLSGKELWVDVSVVHPTAKSYIAREVKEQDSKCGQGAAVRYTIKSKNKQYVALLEVASHQLAHGRRANLPLLIPAVMSSYGEVSQPLYRLYKILECAKKGYLERHPRYRRKKEMLLRRFMNRMKSSIAIACAVGTAEMMYSAGRMTVDRGHGGM